MSIPSAIAVALLDRLEREERKLLAWGYTEGTFTGEELETYARAELDSTPASASGPTVDSVLQELLSAHWLFPVPTTQGEFRTRSAEVVRLISKLRQIRVYPNTPEEDIPSLWRTGRPLVADFRFQAPPRTFPRRNVDVKNVASELGQSDASLEAHVLGAFVGKRLLSGFQVRATRRILGHPQDGGTVVCSGTGSGKTIAFYLPAFMKLAPLLGKDPWTKCLAVYPRNELLKDQLREAIANGAAIRATLEQHGKRAISFGALFGDVKKTAGEVAHPQYGWKAVSIGRQTGRLCPFLKCPWCGESMYWRDDDRARAHEQLTCMNSACGQSLGPDVLRLTRASLQRQPPDILFVSTEMMNRNMSASEYHRLLGIGVSEARRPQLVLLDEIHTYEGASGAHVALLLRRWKAYSSAKPHFVGLSATLEEAPRFFSDLTGQPVAEVDEVTPLPSELEAEGADYQLAIRGESAWGTSLLSTTIQTLMLLRRVLAPRNGTPLTLAGSRVFAFSDRLDGINRLLEDLRDAEGRYGDSNRLASSKRVLAGLRSERLPEAAARYLAGQSWNLVDSIRPHLNLVPTLDSSLSVSRTTAQDTGVDSHSDIVVATASLEVGYDDATVGAVLQHKAPRSAAAFLQRKGRAGRLRRQRDDGTSVSMRPWTVVVLSDFGKDRIAYQDYEHIFSPTLKPRYLPTRNRTLLRIQATYALFEYLGFAASRKHFEAEPWRTLAAPSGSDLSAEQRFYEEQLRLLLADGAKQKEFARFIQRALSLPIDEVNALLWEPPRSVMMEAIPTLFRRLSRNWSRAFELAKEPIERQGPPLPDFVQRKLFGKLLVPEVSLLVPVPGQPASASPSEEMVLAQALGEFPPGRVSKRFDVAGGVSHWVAPSSGATLPIDAISPPELRIPLGRFQYLGPNGPEEVVAFRPTTIVTTNPDSTVATTSSARARWGAEIVVPQEGFALEAPLGVSLSLLVESLCFHTHHLGNPVELRRFVVGSDVSLVRAGGKREPERTIRLVDGAGAFAALGWDSEVDALSVRIRVPDDFRSYVASTPELLRLLRVERFRDLFRTDPTLDGVLNSFQRDALVDAFTAAALEKLLSSPALEMKNACESLDVDTLRRTMGLGVGMTDDDHDEEGVPRRLKELREVLNQGFVMPRLRACSAALWEAVEASWDPWLREGLRATLGASLREAIVMACPDVDEDDLLVEATGTGRGADDTTIWISETTVGGAGALEHFYSVYARDPRQFARVWHGALLPSDAERVAVAFEDALERGAGPGRSPALAEAFAGVRAAHGHQASQDAVIVLRETLTSVGIESEHATMTALFARVLRPGSSPDLDIFLQETLSTWRQTEERSGIVVDVQLFAHLMSARSGLESLVPGAPAADAPAMRRWRFETLGALLWRRPTAVRKGALRLGNPYAAPGLCDRLIVPLPESRAPVVEAELENWFDALTEALNRTGVARLRAPRDQERRLADAIRWLALHPIDTGGLQVFARIGGFSRGFAGAELTVELPEALQ